MEKAADHQRPSSLVKPHIRGVNDQPCDAEQYSAQGPPGNHARRGGIRGQHRHRGAFPTEFADIQREYPIFFRKDPDTDEYSAVALLGLTKDENLFLEGDRWDASYIPGIIARGPFLIGFQEREESGESVKEPMIHIDLDHPRVSQSEGEPVFLENGGNSRYLDRIASILNGINDGLVFNKAMFALFTKLRLIEPLKLEIKLDADSLYNLVGLHTISEPKLRNLGAEGSTTCIARAIYRDIFSVGLAPEPRPPDRAQAAPSAALGGDGVVNHDAFPKL